jgi:hypothetical protein
MESATSGGFTAGILRMAALYFLGMRRLDSESPQHPPPPCPHLNLYHPSLPTFKNMYIYREIFYGAFVVLGSIEKYQAF